MNRILVSFLLSAASVLALTPAELKIGAAKTVAAKPGAGASAFTDLAWAYIKRGRETSDAQYYALAQQQIDRALKIDADDFEAWKAHCAILLARGENAEALELARKLNKRTPDDVLVYGFLADADIALGKIDDAEKAAQWMLDLRPGNVPGFLRGAELRRIFGDADGAIDWLSQAYRRVRPEETEERAYILTRISEVYVSKGDAKGALRTAEQSLKLFPGYPLALKQIERAKAVESGTTSNSQTAEKRSSSE